MTYSLDPKSRDWYVFRKMRQEMWSRLAREKPAQKEWIYSLQGKFGTQEMIRPVSPKALIYNATKRIKQLAEPKINKQNSKYTVDKTLQKMHKEIAESIFDYEKAVLEEKNLKTVLDEIEFSIEESRKPALITQKEKLTKEHQKSSKKTKSIKNALKTAVHSLQEYEKSLKNKKVVSYKETSDRTKELAKGKNYENYLNNLVNYGQPKYTKSSAQKYIPSERIKQLAVPRPIHQDVKSKEQLPEKQKSNKKRKTKNYQRIHQLSQPKKLFCEEKKKKAEKNVNWKKVNEMSKPKQFHPDYQMPKTFDEIYIVSSAAKSRKVNNDRIDHLSAPVDRPDPRTILENEKAFVVSKPALSFKINERIEQLATPVVRN